MNTTKIKEASIYRNGAYVTRIGNVEVRQGKQTIIIEGLTASLDPSTVTVALPQSVSGSNVNVERFAADQLVERKKELTRKLEKVQNRISILNDQIEIMKANTDFSAKEGISIKEMNEYIEALPEKLEAVYEKITKLQDEETDLKKQLKEKGEQDQGYYVRVDVDAKENGAIPVQLRYFERNTSWYPLYEIHTEEDDKLTIRLKAKIAQHTIEEWKDVALKLFTGNPSISADIPELYPWRLDFARPYVAMAKNAMFGAAARGSAVQDMMVEDGAAPMYVEEEMLEVSADLAESVQNDTMMEYDLSGTYDLDKENEISADLTSHQIDCKYHVVAVPKLDSYGYLAAEVKTADIEELIDSSANVFHKGTYLGNIYLNPDQTKETYDISLGKDESIRLKRDLKKKYTSNVLLKGTKKTEYVYELQIVSLKNSECQLTLLDQIPVSEDKTIVIDKDELSQGKLNEETGEVRWDFVLPASEKKNLTLAYSVSWPKDKNLNM